MRYYSIVITDQDGKLIQTPSSIPGSGATYTSFANNKSNPAALQVELDIPLAAYATPVGGALIRVWGISLAEISQANQLNPSLDKSKYKNIEVYAGMQKGLPLANPRQKGLLAAGTIQQAFGNWVGTNMTLDIIMAPDFGSNANPKNIVVNWRAGTSLSQSIELTLKNAFPKLKKPVINISPLLVLNNNEVGYYNTLAQFAYYLKGISVSIIGSHTYQGVDIFLDQGALQVSDGTTQDAPKQIAFQDLIGQPTWIEGNKLQFKCVMRGDITINDFVKMPPALVTTVAAASSALVNQKAAFQGVFQTSLIRHVGNFRQADAESWITTFDAYPQNPQPAGTTAAQAPGITT